MHINEDTVLLEVLQSSFFETISDKIEVKHLFKLYLSVKFVDNHLRIKFRIDQQKIDFLVDSIHFELDNFSSFHCDTSREQLNLFGTDVSVSERETEGITFK